MREQLIESEGDRPRLVEEMVYNYNINNNDLRYVTYPRPPPIHTSNEVH